MNVLKPFLNPKKLRKLQNNPQAFFKDALDKRIIPIQNQLKHLKPKKKHAFAEYYIISAVYNVEKYLDDYFNSILKQRLDFKNNIKIICVDDGSTDRSAEIIQNYQRKFPENIVYLHKENGGQASARNLGLQWLQKKLGYLEGTSAEATASLRGSETNGEILASRHCEEQSDEAIHNVESHLKDSITKTSDCKSMDCHDSSQNLTMTQSHQVSHCEDDRTKQSITLHTKDSTTQSRKSNIIDCHCHTDKSARNDAVRNVDCHENQRFSRNDSNKPIWVTFTDPDDFLDRDYFYEVDKFLEENQEKDICMVGCNMVFYYEEKKAFSDSHPLKYKFKEELTIKRIANLENFIQLTASDTFLKFSAIQNSLYFDINLKPNFEDAKFVNEFFLKNMKSQVCFLRNAKYFYRKRANRNFIFDKNYFIDYAQIMNKTYKLNYFLQQIYKELNYIPNFIQNLIIYDYFWLIEATINNNSRFDFHTREERDRFFESLENIFSFIDVPNILKFNVAGYVFYHRVGFLNCFKKEYPLFQITYITEFDATKAMVKIHYFTPDKEDIESIRFDDVETYADYHKIQQFDFYDRIFVYCKHLWVKVPQNSRNLEVFIRGQKARITLNSKQFMQIDCDYLRNKFSEIQSYSNLWIFMDREDQADDNAEHLYRYISQNYPKRNMVYAINKACSDWDRLQKEGFKLVDFGGEEFIEVAKNTQKYISSHSNGNVIKFFDCNNTSCIFLQHGITKDDVSEWLNQRKIPIFITATRAEYDSIYKNFNHYKFGDKEVQLTGFARHDSLLYKNSSLKSQKQILIMLTWRKQLGVLTSNNENTNITKSEYFLKYNSLLHSKILEQLCMRYGYQVVFNPHPYIKGCLLDIKLPHFISLIPESQSIQESFCESALLITDYSSVAFEMAYLKKPVLYYQFDEEEFFANHSYRKGYFDYRTNGFGPVVTTEEDLLKELEILLKNNCKVGEPYKSNIENTFEFRDGKCCERIYQAILELDKPYERKWTLDDVLNLAHNALEHQCYKEASERFRFVLEHLGENGKVGLTALSLRGANEVRDEAIHNLTKGRFCNGIAEEIIFNYLYASRLNQTSQEALEFIKAQEYESKLAFSNKVKFEIIKNYIEILDAREVIARLENLRDAIPQEELLEFAYLKLRIYAYLGDKQKLKEVYNELKNTYNIDKKDLDLDLFLFQNELIKAASLQTASTSAGGGGELYEFSNFPDIQ